MPNDVLKLEIKRLIIEALRIKDVDPRDIDDDAPLFGNSALGLDSVDSLEIIVALQRRYGARVDDQNLARTVLHSVSSIADFVSGQSRPPVTGKLQTSP